MHVGAWVNTAILDSNVWKLIKPKQVWTLDYVTRIPLKQTLCIIWEELISFLWSYPISGCCLCGNLWTKWKEAVLLATLCSYLYKHLVKRKIPAPNQTNANKILSIWLIAAISQNIHLLFKRIIGFPEFSGNFHCSLHLYINMKESYVI